MILDKEIKIKKKGNNKLLYYKELGYDVSDDFFVKPEHICPTTTSLINVKCDYCDNEVLISYKNYYRNINRSKSMKYACCKKCSINKTHETNLDKYGVLHPMLSDVVKNKTKETNLKKYGTEYTFNNEQIKEKIKKINLDKYGVDNPFKLDKIQKNIKETNLEKYGVENVFQSFIIKEKIKKTNLEKWGSEYYVISNDFLSNIELIKEKIRHTNLDKMGVCHFTLYEKYRKDNFSISKDINYISYIGNNESMFHCQFCDNDYKISSDLYRARKINKINTCTICNPIGELSSIKEKDLYIFISNIYKGSIIKNYRDEIEIDIYLPELKIGFEFNGLYWHSEKHKNKYYHKNKTEFFRKKGIRLIHIWEDDWSFKRNIIESQIKNIIGITDQKIWARKCQIKEISDISIIKDFLNNNHLQGYVSSVVKLCLVYDNKIVSIITFDHNEGRKKMKDNEWNISRFCNIINTSVIGGVSKLLNYFNKNYNTNRIISYVDNGWSNGNLYEKLGFNLIKEITPDYYYIVNNKRVNKSKYRKYNLKSTINESQYMKGLNIYRIYDAGKIKFEKIRKIYDKI